MSVHVSSLVWRADMPMAKKIVLLKLADHAKDDGSDVFPSQKLVALECGCSDRHVRSVEEWAVEAGILKQLPSHRNRANHYSFDLSVLQSLSIRNAIPNEEDMRNAVPVDERSNRNEVPNTEVIRNDVPNTEASNRNAVPPERNGVPPERNSIPTNHQLNTHQPSVVVDDDTNQIAIKVLDVLRELPGMARASANPQWIAEVITENPDIDPTDWLKIARGCRDWCSEWASMKQNHTKSHPPSTILREFLSKQSEHKPEKKNGKFAGAEDDLEPLDPRVRVN